MVAAGERPQLPPNVSVAPHGYKELMEQCWASYPDKRPPFPTIVELLTRMEHNSVSSSTL